MFVISVLIMVFCLIFRYPLLRIIFGQVERMSWKRHRHIFS